MALQPTADLIASQPDAGLDPLPEPGTSPPDEQAGAASEPPLSEPGPCRYPALLARVCRALIDPEGYDAGLRRLDDDLRRRGPSQFARFYIEELLGRSPDTAAIAQEVVVSPSRHIRQILSSNEFMEQHDIVLQREFAHLSREFFFDIPKSGGATLFEAFRSDPRFCPIHLFPAYDNGWFGASLAYLRNTILRLEHPQARHISVFGHGSAVRILNNTLKRGWDSAFAILRDPIDTCLSVINYALDLLRTKPSHPDVIRWRCALELSDSAFLPDRRAALDLAPKIIDLVAPGNPLCEILGSEPSLESVLDNAAILDLKIIRFEQLDDYIRFRGTTRYGRMNVSARYVELADLDRRARLAIYEKNAEDIKFCDWVGRHMVPGNGPWFEL